MKKLLDGYRRFHANARRALKPTLETLAEDGQNPRALVVSCIDSRVDPSMIFDALPGEFLTVRNIASLIPPYERDAHYHGTSAALEFAVRVMQVDHIVVLGHSLCGGVKALLNGAPEEARDFVAPWMQIAAEARTVAKCRHTPEEQQQSCEHETVKISLTNLMTFPWVEKRVKAGNLKLHGAWFDIHNGALEMLHEDGRFKVVE